MLKINIGDDEELQGVVNKFISSLLPHENYDSKFFLKNLETVLKYIRLEEFTMEYRMMFSAFCNLAKIKASFDDFVPTLDRDTFSSLVEASVMDAITDYSIGIVDWLNANGMESNLSIETVRESACQVLWQASMDLHDECMKLAVGSAEAINYEPELREVFKSCVSQQSVNTQIAILRDGARIGRDRFKGFDGWLQYSKDYITEINARLNQEDEESTIVVDSILESDKLLHSMMSYWEKIADWGIPCIDDFTPISRHKLIVIVGRENIGKTKFAVNSAVNVLMAGKRVAFMCGETQAAVVYSDIIINYVYKKYGYVLKPEHVYDYENTPDEIRKVVGMTINTLIEGGLLILQKEFRYDTCMTEMETLYQTTKFDVLFIDHSCALAGSVGDGSLKAKVDRLADDVMRFRKQHPVCVVVNSHPSTDEKASNRSGKVAVDSPTKGSQDLSVNADEVYILRDNEVLQRQGLLELSNFKRRGAQRFTEPVILQKKFEVSALIYDESRQAIDSIDQLEKAQALALLEDDVEDIYNL